MKCKQFLKNLPDWSTGRLASHLHSEMAAHSAGCPSCARSEQEERALCITWQNVSPQSAPNILPRLSDRLNAPRPRWNPYLAAAGTACALATAAWFYIGGVSHKEISYQSVPVATNALNSPPLEDMLEGVRWRSSDEWDAQREPPAYNEDMKMLLLVKENH